jgi:hypothetical protein
VLIVFTYILYYVYKNKKRARSLTPGRTQLFAPVPISSWLVLSLRCPTSYSDFLPISSPGPRGWFSTSRRTTSSDRSSLIGAATEPQQARNRTRERDASAGNEDCYAPFTNGERRGARHPQKRDTQRAILVNEVERLLKTLSI